MGQNQGAGTVGMVKRRGAILLIVLLVVLTISLLGATLVALFFSVLTSSQVELDRARALYLAEAGVAKAVNGLKTQASQEAQAKEEKKTSDDQQPDKVIAPVKAEEGTFEVFNDFSQSTIVSVGISNGVKRTIQVKYNAF